MGDNTKMGRLAGTEELHAKQQEAARKEAERAARMRRGGSPNASRPRAPNDAPPGKRIRNGPTVQFTTQEANTIGAASGVAQNALYSAGNAWSCDPFGAAGPPSSLEPIIRLEALIDARIDKALARLVSLQEYERVRATYSPPLIPV